MKDINIELHNKSIHQDDEIKGTVTVNYLGKYDGIVINTLISDSNELVIYRSYNGEKISQNVSRLFVSRDKMPENKVEFTAAIVFEPKKEHEVKFRVSIIEQHKEIASDILFARYN